MILDKQEQSRALDYVKAIGIVSVVIGHFPNSIFNIMTPYMFHMPLFFFIGGILFKEKNWLDFSVVIMKKFVIYITTTYIIIGLLSIFLTNFFGFTNLPNPFSETISSTITQAFNQNFHNNSLFLVAWFLVAYMVALTILNTMYRVMNMIGLKQSGLFITLAGLASGWVAIDFISIEYKNTGNILWNYLCEFLVAFMFMTLGKAISFNIFKYLNTTNAIVFFVILVTLKYAGIASDISMSWSVYHHGFVDTLIQIFLCIYLVFYVSSVFSKSVKSNLVLMIGQNTKPIMSYHLFVFFVVDIFLQWLSIGDYRTSTALSGHNQQAPYWALYVSFAIIFPIFSSKLYEKISSLLINSRLINKAP